MSDQTNARKPVPDSAAVLGAAISLWQACHKAARRKPRVNLSECYQGGDQCMREVMRVASLFEEWACCHVAFEKLDDVWPYLLEDKFGHACVEVVGVCGLAKFDREDCLRVAIQLRLPVRHDVGLPLPILEESSNPNPGSAFLAFRIQTVRELREDGSVVPFTYDDEPFASEFSQPYFAFYGVSGSGELEHIADRKTYADVVSIARRLIPNLEFATCPTSSRRPSVRR